MPAGAPNVSIVPLRAAHAVEADRIVRLAFATFMGTEPESDTTGRDFIRGRLHAYPDGAMAAMMDDTLIGSNIMANWGSFGFFGPLTVHPAYWDRGVGKRLMERTMETFDRWNTKHAALFTFADSPKHHGLYQRFDFWPRFLAPTMSKRVSDQLRKRKATAAFQRFSQLDDRRREECLAESLGLCDALLEGLDLRREIDVVQNLHLGDSIWLWSDAGLEAFAVCHYGKGSEASPDSCYVKFAAVRPGPSVERWFTEMLAGCEALAAMQGLATIDAGANIERLHAYRTMLRAGFTPAYYGVQMFRHNDPAYNRADAYVIDDLR